MISISTHWHYQPSTIRTIKDSGCGDEGPRSAKRRERHPSFATKFQSSFDNILKSLIGQPYNATPPLLTQLRAKYTHPKPMLLNLKPPTRENLREAL
jgi:hypothetical protein